MVAKHSVGVAVLDSKKDCCAVRVAAEQPAVCLLKLLLLRMHCCCCCCSADAGPHCARHATTAAAVASSGSAVAPPAAPACCSPAKGLHTEKMEDGMMSETHTCCGLPMGAAHRLQRRQTHLRSSAFCCCCSGCRAITVREAAAARLLYQG